MRAILPLIYKRVHHCASWVLRTAALRACCRLYAGGSWFFLWQAPAGCREGLLETGGGQCESLRGCLPACAQRMELWSPNLLVWLLQLSGVVLQSPVMLLLLLGSVTPGAGVLGSALHKVTLGIALSWNAVTRACQVVAPVRLFRSSL